MTLMKQPKRRFEYELTRDQSPSLRLYLDDSDESKKELMHSSAGAATETQEIYGRAINAALNVMKAEDIHFLVVGLGLGYIEALIADKTQGWAKSVVSFEVQSDLVQNFKDWLNDRKMDVIYDQMLKSVTGHTNKIALQKLNHFIQGDILLDYKQLDKKYHVICYDAFSSHTDSELWSTEFLVHFINHSVNEDAIFVTYAATSSLKKALKQTGFQIYKMPGFSGKRESTYAARGRFISG